MGTETAQNHPKRRQAQKQAPAIATPGRTDKLYTHRLTSDVALQAVSS